MLNLIDLYLEESIAISKSIDRNSLKQLVELIIDCYESENTVYAMGNGGNCGFVSNLVNDLNFLPFSNDNKEKQQIGRNKFKAVSLCDSGATLTGIANDFGYEDIFVEQLKFCLNENDILIGFSGSGNSKNVLKAFEYGESVGTKNVLLTRNQTNKISEYSNLVIYVSGTSTFPGQVGGNNNNFHFEDFTSKMSHIVCGILKSYVQPNSK